MAFTGLSGTQTYWPVATCGDAHFNVRLKRVSLLKNIAMIISIIIMALAVTIAVFAVLYFQDRSESEKYEKRADSLSSELVDLKCQMARIETQSSDSLVPINAERVAEFLRMENAADVSITEKSEAVFFTFSNERFMVDCRRLPQMIAVRIDWDLKESFYGHLDIAERLASEITNQFAMVKASVDKEASLLSFYIVSSDRTMAAFKGNFSMYMSIFSAADEMFNEKYRKVVGNEHPADAKVDRANGSGAELLLEIGSNKSGLQN